MTVTFHSYRVGTTCQNCKKPIYRRQYEDGRHTDWTHTNGEIQCPPTYANPPEKWRD